MGAMTIRHDAAREAIFEMRCAELETRASAVIGEREYFTGPDLETLTGTKAATWRYWAHLKKGPESFSLGKHRVWKRAAAMRWLVEQELA